MQKDELNFESHTTMPFTSVLEDTVGLPPGSAIYIGDNEAEESLFSLYTYNESNLCLYTSKDLNDILTHIHCNRKCWLNINGISKEIIQCICQMFSISNLTMEDILNTKHRPKIDEFENYLFFITKMILYRNDEISSEQVSFVLKNNLLITIQESNGDCFDPVRNRLHSKNGKIRRKGVDYLTYTLFDVIVDNYFLVLEAIGAKIEDADKKMEEINDSEKIILYLQNLKQDLSMLKRIIWPTREIISKASKVDEDHISEYLKPYLRDLYENILQVLEAIESNSEQISNLIEYSLARVNTRMGEIMKVIKT